jgi:hypothetical protein
MTDIEETGCSSEEIASAEERIRAVEIATAETAIARQFTDKAFADGYVLACRSIAAKIKSGA